MLKKLSDCLRRHTFLCCVVLTGMLVLSVVAGISLGTAKISFSTVWRIILHNLFGLFSIDDIKLSTLNIVWRIRIPRALTQSEQETKAETWLRRMSQEMVLGSPQARPAMMVWRSPSTMRGAPSPARAPR